MKNLELNTTEQDVIVSALNFYWNDAHRQLSERKRHPLGDLEAEQLQERMKIVKPLIEKVDYL